MKSVLHNWVDGDAARILSTCRAAMQPDARARVGAKRSPLSVIAATPT
jgi:hypothetical protein